MTVGEGNRFGCIEDAAGIRHRFLTFDLSRRMAEVQSRAQREVTDLLQRRWRSGCRYPGD